MSTRDQIASVRTVIEHSPNIHRSVARTLRNTIRARGRMGKCYSHNLQRGDLVTGFSHIIGPSLADSTRLYRSVCDAVTG